MIEKLPLHPVIKPDRQGMFSRGSVLLYSQSRFFGATPGNTADFPLDELPERLHSLARVAGFGKENNPYREVARTTAAALNEDPIHSLVQGEDPQTRDQALAELFDESRHGAIPPPVRVAVVLDANLRHPPKPGKKSLLEKAMQAVDKSIKDPQVSAPRIAEWRYQLQEMNKYEVILAGEQAERKTKKDAEPALPQGRHGIEEEGLAVPGMN